MSNNKLHDRRVKEIIRTPSIIGLDGILLTTDEAHIFSREYRESGIVVGEPDGLAFDPSTLTLYNIEYKCGEDRNHAMYQLARNGSILQNIFSQWNVVDVYVHGRLFETEMREYASGHGRDFKPKRRRYQ